MLSLLSFSSYMKLLVYKTNFLDYFSCLIAFEQVYVRMIIEKRYSGTMIDVKGGRPFLFQPSATEMEVYKRHIHKYFRSRAYMPIAYNLSNLQRNYFCMEYNASSTFSSFFSSQKSARHQAKNIADSFFK